MAAQLSLDTTFLIDLHRERRSGREGPAHTLLSEESDAELFLSVVALGEFSEGFPSSEHPVVTAVRVHHTLLLVDPATALLYGGVARELRQRGTLIGANDLWIAATSLRHQLPLVTANADHFGRVDGLDVVPYRDISAG